MALTDNLVSYWKLDESSGNAADSAGTNTLTNVGTMPYGSGIILNGAQVSSGKFLKITDASQTGLDPAGDFSIQAWVNATSLPDPSSIVIKDNAGGGQREYWMRLGAGGAKIDFLIFDTGAGNSDVTGSTAITTGSWFHCVATYHFVTSGTSVMTVYRNGVQDGQNTAATGPTKDSTAAFGVGERADDLSENFNGTIDEVGFWSRALSGAEVTQLYNSGAGLAYPFTLPTSTVRNLTLLNAG